MKKGRFRLGIKPMSKAVVGISMGDAAGIGPELCLRMLMSEAVLSYCTPVVFGSLAMLQRVASLTGIDCSLVSVAASEWAGTVVDERGFVVDCGGLDSDAVVCGEVQAACGAAAYDYIKRAISAAVDGKTAAVVTAPIHKEALKLAGVPFHGHTEMLAEQTGTHDYCMMMASDEINVCLVTTHTALANVSHEISEERILKVIELADKAMRVRGRNNPRLTVCGLNPHAGEHGIFGDEEDCIITPAAVRARAIGYNVTDPLPPDTAFVPAVREKTDAYIVMYHDQGLIPFKMLSFDTGVNVTLGLPIIRTSVDHGTAFDIAWQGLASAMSMESAVKMAVSMC
jgi:4-hydroxythreonine-4-phosphate dehydrogenase